MVGQEVGGKHHVRARQVPYDGGYAWRRAQWGHSIATTTFTFTVKRPERKVRSSEHGAVTSLISSG